MPSGAAGGEASAYALITGASYGIGEAFARELARRGWPLILTARSLDRLESLQSELQTAGAEVRILAADLAAGGAARIISTVREWGLEVGLLVNNAGFGAGGPFASADLTNQLAMLEVNLHSLVELTHYFLPEMRRRGRGAIVEVGSVAGFQPGPYAATYAASKAFVLNFSLALWRENREAGVHIMALCPGYTDTHFFAAGGFPKPRRVYTQTAEAVVRECMTGLERRRPVVVTGWPNRLLVVVTRWIPRRWVVNAAARLQRARRNLAD